MSTTAKPIVATTSLSFLLHGMAFAGLLLIHDQASTGRGVEIELIRSAMVSDQQETDVPRKSETVLPSENFQASSTAENTRKETLQKRRYSQNVLTSADDKVSMSAQSLTDKNFSSEQNDKQWLSESNTKQQNIPDNGNSIAQLMQSTNAAQQQHSIVELLHDSISDNKEYPFIARRQRREGVATVGFMLHPDGRIENARLLTSSRTVMLDRAALTAVERIAPFKPAHEYLDHAEEFSIDVVFDLR